MSQKAENRLAKNRFAVNRRMNAEPSAPERPRQKLDPPRRWLEATLSKLSRNSEATVATYVKMYPPDAQGFRMRCSASFLECYALFGSLS